MNDMAQNDVMTSILTILLSIIIYCIRPITLSSLCESPSTVWMYYPCSFILSASSFHCQQASINLSIDQCLNGDITFFWHFPVGNMTISIKSDTNQSFLLHLYKMPSLKRQLIKNIYHLVKTNNSVQENILNTNDNKTTKIVSNENNQCSIKFETSNRIIFDYGTLIRISIWTRDNSIH